MHHITGAPRLTAQGHELMATTFARQAEETAALADAEPDVRLAEVWRRAAAHDAGVSAGHTFRAAELRYAARGGLTLEQARRRFLPGARWTLRWTPGEVYTVRRTERLPNETRVHFDTCWPSSVEVMSEGRGWRLVALAPLVRSDVSP